MSVCASVVLYHERIAVPAGGIGCAPLQPWWTLLAAWPGPSRVCDGLACRRRSVTVSWLRDTLVRRSSQMSAPTKAHTEILHQTSLSQEDPGAEQAPLQDQGEGDRQHEQGGEETVGGAEGARQTVIPGATQIYDTCLTPAQTF